MGLEASLKLKEISYIHSEAYAAGELKHGTISLIEQGTLVIALATYGQLFDKAVSNVIEVQSRGATVLGLTDTAHEEALGKRAERHHHRAGDPSAAHALPGCGAHAAVRLLRGAVAWAATSTSRGTWPSRSRWSESRPAIRNNRKRENPRRGFSLFSATLKIHPLLRFFRLKRISPSADGDQGLCP